MPEGFGKPAKSKSPRRIRKFTFSYRSSDGYLNLLKVEAASYGEAAKEFQRFVRDLEFALRVVADEQRLGGSDYGK